MKVAILAGGRGTRMGNVTESVPKPLVKIGDQPLICHLIDHYVAYGFREFVVALGYHAECARNYFAHQAISVAGDSYVLLTKDGIEISVDLIDTGLQTSTGGRVLRLKPLLNDGTFMLTWGDGLSDVDLDALLATHRRSQRMATVTAVQPPTRFGEMKLDEDRVAQFQEKPVKSSIWINGAFFVLEPEIFERIDGDDSSFERDVLTPLADAEELTAYRHSGFWQCMDTATERDQLEQLVKTGCARWGTKSSPPTKIKLSATQPLGSAPPVSRRRVLVTGHDGYVGRVLIPRLQENGYEVCGLDTFLFREEHESATGKPIEVIEKDFRDVVVDDLRGYDAIINLAGISNDPLGDFSPTLTHQLNCQAAVNLAECARLAGVRRFVQASTCSVYGASEDGWLTEESPLNPVTPYAVAKADAERGLRELATDDFSPTFLRLATAYGVSSRLRGDLVVNNLVGYAVATSTILLKSDGMAWRPLVHVEDIARAMIATLQASPETIHNQVFNVGNTAANYRVHEIAALIAKIMPGAKVEHVCDAQRDRRNYRVNCDRLLSQLPAAEPRWNLSDGIRQLIEHFESTKISRDELEGPMYHRLDKIQHLLNQGRLSHDLRWVGQPELLLETSVVANGG